MKSKLLEKTLVLLSILVFAVALLDIGLKTQTLNRLSFREGSSFFELFYTFFFCLVYFFKLKNSRHLIGGLLRWGIWGLSIILFAAIIGSYWDRHLLNDGLKDVFLLLISWVSITHWLNKVKVRKLHPTFVFVISFAVLIILGTILLLLPNATHHPISVSDAFFTATSAVTVTGLTVVDTAKDFTLLGQAFIMGLFQIGGLGVLIFTNSLLIGMGNNTSFRSRLMIGELLNEENINQTSSVLFRIVLITVSIEVLGAIMIYHNISDVEAVGHKVFFSFFHAISAFCNAGFSLASNSLYEGFLRNNYGLQLIVAILIVFGAMGFNVLSFGIDKIKEGIKKIAGFRGGNFIRKKRKIEVRIAFFTTIALIIFGTVSFFYLERTGVLSAESWEGKLVTSFFNAVTTRTAGFNNVDMGLLSSKTLIIMIFLMWIGASPGSTGGGIKTTTFALALVNIGRIVTNQKRVVLDWRELNSYSLHRMFAIITLSFFAIGLGCFLLFCFDPQVKPIQVLFECVSAYSTVGLSTGITASLSFGSQLVLIFLMFTGRITFLTLLSGLLMQFMEDKNKTALKLPTINIQS